jgi:hypothetical protein
MMSFVGFSQFAQNNETMDTLGFVIYCACKGLLNQQKTNTLPHQQSSKPYG